MSNILRTTAVATLHVLIFIVALFSENSAQMWFPAKDELTGISKRTVTVIDVTLLIIISIVIYLFIRALSV
jgi:small-conductance mechanosensitive channel